MKKEESVTEFSQKKCKKIAIAGDKEAK